MAKSFRELKVWRLSMDLTMLIYEVTSDFPKHEIYGLTSQMRRAAVSISSNIAEGAGRQSRRDFRQFVITARGSTCELHTQVLIASRLQYCTESQLAEAEQMVAEVGRMLNGLAKYLEAQSKATSTIPH